MSTKSPSTKKPAIAIVGTDSKTKDLMAEMLAGVSDTSDIITVADMLIMSQDLDCVANMEPPEKVECMTPEEFKDAMRKHQKFTYAAGRNLDKARRVSKRAQKQAKPAAAYMTYHDACKALRKENALTADDKPVIDQAGDFVIDPEKSAPHDKGIELLKAEHAAAIEQRDVQVDVYNEMVEEPIDIKLYMISDELLPDTLTAGQIAACALFITESE